MRTCKLQNNHDTESLRFSPPFFSHLTRPLGTQSICTCSEWSGGRNGKMSFTVGENAVRLKRNETKQNRFHNSMLAFPTREEHREGRHAKFEYPKSYHINQSINQSITLFPMSHDRVWHIPQLFLISWYYRKVYVSTIIIETDSRLYSTININGKSRSSFV